MKDNVDLYKQQLEKTKEESKGLCQQQVQQMSQLFNGLKDDNTKLAEEVRFVQQENTHLREVIENQKMAISQQNNIV